MTSGHQIGFFMKPGMLGQVIEKALHGWRGAVVAERPDVLPIEFEIIELEQLTPFLVDEAGVRFWLSLEGVPNGRYDLEYTYRTRGSHVRVEQGRVEPERRYIRQSTALADHRAKPALGLVTTLRKAIARVSRRGVTKTTSSGKSKLVRNLYWTPDLVDWNLGGHRAAPDDQELETESQ